MCFPHVLCVYMLREIDIIASIDIMYYSELARRTGESNVGKAKNSCMRTYSTVQGNVFC